MNQFQHCCEKMGLALVESEGSLVFSTKFREYGILIMDGGSAVIAISHCPWCSSPLPRSLRDDWFDALEAKGIDPFGDEVPDEFLDGRWYGSC